MIEGEDVELSVVAERHANHLFVEEDLRCTFLCHVVSRPASSAAWAAATRAIGRRNGEQLT